MSAFPTNYDLVIGDDQALMLFSPVPKGAPGQGFAVHDRNLIEDGLVDLFNRYWNDERAVVIKGAGRQSDAELDGAIKRARAMMGLGDADAAAEGS